MFRVCVVLIATIASFCGHQARAAVTVSPSHFRPKPGEQVSTTCTISGETFNGWFKDGKKVSTLIAESVHVVSIGNAHTLTFTDVKVSEGGIYECRGSSNKKTLQLDVAYDTSSVDHQQHLKIGQTDAILCKVDGVPKPTVTWKKDGTILDLKNNARYTLLPDGSLRISMVKLSDQGNYTCLVRQSGYSSPENIEVYPVETPKMVPFPNPRKYGTKGYPLSFVCKASGIPPPKYTWLSPQGVEINSLGNFYVNNGNMTIKKVDSNLKGKYTCKAYNEIEKFGDRIGEVSDTVEIVDVYVAPKITSKSGDEQLTRGQPFHLECKATGNPPPTVEWKRNGAIDPRQEKKAGQSIIKFTNLQREDGGRYTCEATNSAVDSNGNRIVATMVKNINIKSPPYINKQASPKEVFSFLGNSAPTFVTCTFGGYPLPFVVMTFNRKLVSNATTTANVSVKTDAKRKFGVYQCFAKNEFGIKNLTVQLKQVGKPSEVQEFRATSTCNGVVLTWKLPLTDGGMPINKYVATYEGMTFNIDGWKTTHTITGLERNTEYKFCLRATNKGEWGQITCIEIKTTEFCAPGRPIIYEPSSPILEGTSITLKWRRPDDTGGDEAIEYQVRYRDESENKPGPWIVLKVTKELQYEIKGLDAKRYKIEVVAINKGGKSNPDERYYQIANTEARGSQCRLVASLFVTLVVGILHLL